MTLTKPFYLGKYEVTQWVMWQMANQGPKLGECGHFRRAGPDAGDLTYAIARFTDEAAARANSERPAEVVEDDRRAREGARPAANRAAA